MRVIVTGSRDWSDRDDVWLELDKAMKSDPGHRLHIMHGGCPTGADAHAETWYQALTILRDRCLTREIFPADWEKYGKRAGPIRNAEMVKAGADLVLAFPLPGGRGTQNTIRLAREAGIPVKVWDEDE